ncbi:hypothetical protein VNO77_24258 [Canavalia gladiata]|uniref:Uncharacterized protein n=1 Tax=Canavalia gladiata TaxID=3824 RepID=A0AAN9L989_CANGL
MRERRRGDGVCVCVGDCRHHHRHHRSVYKKNFFPTTFCVGDGNGTLSLRFPTLLSLSSSSSVERSIKMVKSIFECNPITLSLSRLRSEIDSYMDEQWFYNRWVSLEGVYLREKGKSEWGGGLLGESQASTSCIRPIVSGLSTQEMPLDAVGNLWKVPATVKTSTGMGDNSNKKKSGKPIMRLTGSCQLCEGAGCLGSLTFTLPHRLLLFMTIVVVKLGFARNRR